MSRDALTGARLRVRAAGILAWGLVGACAGPGAHPDRPDGAPFDAFAQDTTIDGGAPADAFDGLDASDGGLQDGALQDGALQDGALQDGAMPEDGGVPCECPALACQQARCVDGACLYAPSGPAPCDNGEVGGGVCVDGACRAHRCGDGVRATEGPAREACDDGNLDDEDGCTRTCEAAPFELTRETEHRRIGSLRVATSERARAALWTETRPDGEVEVHVVRWARGTRAGESQVVWRGYDLRSLALGRSGPETFIAALATSRGIEQARLGEGADPVWLVATDDPRDAAPEVTPTERGHWLAWRREASIFVASHEGTRVTPHRIAGDATGALALAAHPSRGGVVLYETEAGIVARGFDALGPIDGTLPLGRTSAHPAATWRADGWFAAYTEHADDFFGDVFVHDGTDREVVASDARETARAVVPFGGGLAVLYASGAFRSPALVLDGAAVPPEWATAGSLLTYAEPGAAVAADADGLLLASLSVRDGGPERQLVLFALPGS